MVVRILPVLLKGSAVALLSHCSPFHLAMADSDDDYDDWNAPPSNPYLLFIYHVEYMHTETKRFLAGVLHSGVDFVLHRWVYQLHDDLEAFANVLSSYLRMPPVWYPELDLRWIDFADEERRYFSRLKERYSEFWFSISELEGSVPLDISAALALL